MTNPTLASKKAFALVMAQICHNGISILSFRWPSFRYGHYFSSTVRKRADKAFRCLLTVLCIRQPDNLTVYRRLPYALPWIHHFEFLPLI